MMVANKALNLVGLREGTMSLTVGQFEAWLREGLIKLHKDVTGRGPKDAYVKVFKKCIVFYLEDPLTVLERQLLRSGWGIEKIEELRKDLFEAMLPPFKEKIAEKVTANILNAMTIVNAKDQDQFGIIVLD
jgi:uncharacterized protein YbcI